MALQLDPTVVPKVSLEFMNDDHGEVVALINKILTLLESGSTDEVTQVLQAFIEHNREHFAREEAEMIRVNFPPYSCHKGEHERVLAELEEVFSDWKTDNNRGSLQSYLTQTAANWLVNHVSTMDTVTAMFVNQHS